MDHLPKYETYQCKSVIEINLKEHANILKSTNGVFIINILIGIGILDHITLAIPKIEAFLTSLIGISLQSRLRTQRLLKRRHLRFLHGFLHYRRPRRRHPLPHLHHPSSWKYHMSLLDNVPSRSWYTMGKNFSAVVHAHYSNKIIR